MDETSFGGEEKERQGLLLKRELNLTENIENAAS